MLRNSLTPHARFLLGLVFSFVALQAGAVPVSLPDSVARAHTVFIENETGFPELQYTAILELNKWGRFELADSREKADLIMRLENGSHVRAVPDGQFPSTGGMNAVSESEIPKGHTRIALLDPKTNSVLWSDTHKTEGGKVKNGHLLDGLREAFESYDKARR
jgi:hypothetical protein